MVLQLIAIQLMAFESKYLDELLHNSFATLVVYYLYKLNVDFVIIFLEI